MKTLLLLCCAVFAVSDAFFITSSRCKPPSRPYHGTYRTRKSSYKWGEKITYYCTSRYFRLRKPLTRTCIFGTFQPKVEAYCDPICSRGYAWMGYYDRDDPSATGDHETLSDLRKKHPKLCARPISIQAKVRGSLADYRTTGQKVEISPTLGLRCLNKNVKGNCKDYIVRFCCDVNECDNNPCNTNARCNNFAGSYRCTCNTGYTGNGRTCTDVDECASSPCHEHATCTNTVGSYGCACNSGYSGNGHSCGDIDECEGDGACGEGAVCTNTDGSHTCSCPNGYTGNPYVQCTDVDECANSPCHEHASCSNSVGSYSCACNTGYSGNGHSCQDIDECEGGGPCGQGAVCTNTDGSHACSCPRGYTGNPYVQCTGVSCPQPTAPKNGKVSTLKTSYQPGDHVFFKCYIHYKDITTPKTFPRYTCQANGEWSGHKPTCEGSCDFACNPFPGLHRGSPPCGCNATCEEEENCCRDFVQACVNPPPTFSPPIWFTPPTRATRTIPTHPPLGKK